MKLVCREHLTKNLVCRGLKSLRTTALIVNFQVQVDVFQKRGSKFFQFYKASPINWCHLNDPNFQLVTLQKFFIQILSKPLKRLFHPCPFEGRHSFSNITFSPDALHIGATKSLQIIFRIIDSDNFTLFIFSTNFIITE